MISYGRQSISAADIEAVVKVLQSDYLTQGPAVPAFENKLASISSAKHAVAVNSATSALHIACLALEVGPGDTVWTSPTTFVASANCARYCGASVDFVDIDPDTWCLSPVYLAEKLKLHQERKLPLPKVVVAVHLCGQSCDMESIAALATQYGFRIIEDASHALGGRYHEAPVGNCSYSDIAVLSFHPVKMITTGEGGAALTNNEDLYRSMARLRSHGITRDVDQLTCKSPGPWYYEQLDLGFNYRMTDLQAALGASQLTRLEQFLKTRNELAKRYDLLLTDSSFTTQKIPDNVQSSHHLYVVRVSVDRRDTVCEHLRDAGISSSLHYFPVHLQPYYRKLGFSDGMYPEAERYALEAITLPLFPQLTHASQDKVIRVLCR
ncbi:MAG: UDP-4-amino-4,6-dideoxy-N-acetyl-beta-L-altrosamine transaminase [Acidiferrobacteraceae bacterium]|nr:UDP-4-amino-4,6-dideoxy-N-acetyl-beta-L-altrosamine transaminase [Acidiferrobacteraceae bacterium]